MTTDWLANSKFGWSLMGEPARLPAVVNSLSRLAECRPAHHSFSATACVRSWRSPARSYQLKPCLRPDPNFLDILKFVGKICLERVERPNATRRARVPRVRRAFRAPLQTSDARPQTFGTRLDRELDSDGPIRSLRSEYLIYRTLMTNSFFGGFVSPAGGRLQKFRVIHSVPDLGGFGDLSARISFHPAARNETFFEAAGLQGHYWVEQVQRAAPTSAAAPTQRATRRHPCHNHHTPPSSCLQPAELHPHAQQCCTPMLSTLLHPHARVTCVGHLSSHAPWPAALSARAALPGAPPQPGFSSRHGLEEVQTRA
jgi:hypothetical protein